MRFCQEGPKRCGVAAGSAGPDAGSESRNAAAIEDALRNLIENALTHMAPQTEVIVEVGWDGTPSVLDSGPGISADDRPRHFRLILAGKGPPDRRRRARIGDRGGIVKGARRQHHRERPGALGTRFDLRFQSA